MSKNILIGLGAFIFLLVIILIVAVLLARKPAETQKALVFPKEPVTLTFWNLFDDEDVFKEIVADYRQTRPNVTVQYVKKDYETYQEDLLNSLAAGTGPDVFTLRSDWLPKHLDKLAPAPEGFNLIKQGKKEPKKDPAVQFKELFVKAAYEPQGGGLVFENKIYGLPLYLDSLALYYNQTLFDKAAERHSQILRERASGVEDEKEQEKISQERQRTSKLLSQPAQNWTDFVETVKLLTEKDNKGNIAQPAVALGTAKNVAKAADILSLLMLQNNTAMLTQDQKSASFNLSIKKSDNSLVYPGTSALDFYTSFSRPEKEVYTWNNSFPGSVEVFGEGKVAMLFHYSYYIPLLKRKYPDLKFEVAPMPQIKGITDRIDYSYFWPLVVSENTAYPLVGWDFLKFLASKENAAEYQQLSQRPTAGLEKAKEEAKGAKTAYLENFQGKEVFTGQAYTALNWYKAGEPDKIEQVFQNMIEAVLGGQSSQTAIDNAAASVTNILGEAQPLIEQKKKEP